MLSRSPVWRLLVCRLRTLTTEAHATVEPDNSTVYGNFRFSQTDGVGEVTIVGVVGGLNPGEKYFWVFYLSWMLFNMILF